MEAKQAKRERAKAKEDGTQQDREDMEGATDALGRHDGASTQEQCLG